APAAGIGIGQLGSTVGEIRLAMDARPVPGVTAAELRPLLRDVQEGRRLISMDADPAVVTIAASTAGQSRELVRLARGFGCVDRRPAPAAADPQALAPDPPTGDLRVVVGRILPDAIP